jgi:hypothetical protein
MALSLTINKKDKEKFVESVAKSQSSVKNLKSKYSSETPVGSSDFGKPNAYGRFSNIFFRDTSMKLFQKGYLTDLNKGFEKNEFAFC